MNDVATLAYDAAGNQIASTDARGNTSTVVYDALNRPIALTDPLNHTVTAVYDAVGNIIRTIDALGYTGTMTYDALNRRVTVQDPGGGIATLVYDAASNVINTIDQLGNKSTFTYDALNRQTQSTDPRGGVITTAYDGANNVTSVKDPVGNTTSFSYDAANRMTQQTDPLNHSSTYAYDLANRLTSTTDRDGRRIDNTFDAGNRLTGQNWVVSGSTVNTLTFTYDANANLLTAVNNAGAYTMTYDALNRVTVTQEPFGLTLTATYDAVNNRTQLQDSFGGVLTSVYDSANRLTTREFGGASQTPLREDLTYTARDQVATETRYSDLAGQTKIGSSTFTYDPVGRLSNLQHLDGSATLLANYTYTYDLASRLQTEKLNGGATRTYTYDAANELTNDGSNAYTYDLNGNRTMTGYQTGTGNELTNDGTWAYTYDAEGNLTKKSKGTNFETWTYGYDNHNHMVWAKDSATDGGTVTTLATFVYDALGNRLEKDVWTQASGTTTVTRFGYDGDEVWVDLNTSNALQTRYIHGDAVDELFARIGSSGTAAWYLTDRLGSVRDIVNNSGTIIDHLDYDGFGNATETQPTNGDRYKWTGREFDSETGLQYNRARYFDPHVGRWQSEDPLGFSAGDTNVFRYVFNTPLMGKDPSGRGFSSLNSPEAPPVLYELGLGGSAAATITIPAAEAAALHAIILASIPVAAKVTITCIAAYATYQAAETSGIKAGMERVVKLIGDRVASYIRQEIIERLKHMFMEADKGKEGMADAAAKAAQEAADEAAARAAEAAAKQLEMQQEAKRRFDTDRNFSRWWHKEYKNKMKMSGGGKNNPNLPIEDITDGYLEWLSRGCPKPR